MKVLLEDSIRYVKGVGPAKEKLFNNLGIYTVNDLVYYFPRDYEDRTKKKKIFELLDGERISFEATVKGEVSVNYARRNMPITKATVVDESGVISLTWFNATYVKNALKSGKTYTFYGQIKNECVAPIDEKLLEFWK